jgi:hypothetical protein
MQIPVLIEPIAGNGYRARGGEPLAVVVEAPTREEALFKLHEALQARLRNGAEIVPLELTPATHPLAKFVGMSQMIRSSTIGKNPWPSIAGKSTSIRTFHEPFRPGYGYPDPPRGRSSGRGQSLSSAPA